MFSLSFLSVILYNPLFFFIFLISLRLVMFRFSFLSLSVAPHPPPIFLLNFFSISYILYMIPPTTDFAFLTFYNNTRAQSTFPGISFFSPLASQQRRFFLKKRAPPTPPALSNDRKAHSQQHIYIYIYPKQYWTSRKTLENLGPRTKKAR